MELGLLLVENLRQLLQGDDAAEAVLVPKLMASIIYKEDLISYFYTFYLPQYKNKWSFFVISVDNRMHTFTRTSAETKTSIKSHF